jgi:hypothetical protein
LSSRNFILVNSSCVRLSSFMVFSSISSAKQDPLAIDLGGLLTKLCL